MHNNFALPFKSDLNDLWLALPSINSTRDFIDRKTQSIQSFFTSCFDKVETVKDHLTIKNAFYAVAFIGAHQLYLRARILFIFSAVVSSSMTWFLPETTDKIKDFVSSHFEYLFTHSTRHPIIKNVVRLISVYFILHELINTSIAATIIVSFMAGTKLTERVKEYKKDNSINSAGETL